MKLLTLLVILVVSNLAIAESRLSEPALRALAVDVCGGSPGVGGSLDDFAASAARPAWQKEALDYVTTEDWEDSFRRAAETLEREANAKKLNAGTLRACLDVAFRHRGSNAYLPVGAIWCPRVLKGGVWVIAIRWEAAGGNAGGTKKHSAMRHVRALAIDAHTLEIVGFQTCD